MANNHAKLAETGKRLVAKHGREMTFNRRDRAPGDSAKPWNGPADVSEDPAATADLAAISVEPSSAVKLGIATENSDMVKKSSEILIVAPGADFTEDLSTFDEVVDDNEIYRITAVEKLKPGDQTILYFVGVKR